MPFFKELNHVKNAITEFRVWKSSGADFASYIQCVLPTKTTIIIIYIPSRANCPSLKIERQGQ